MWLFVAFLLVPLIEIALFIQVGGLIGLWPTLGIVIATAVLGTYLVHSQGRRALEELRGSFRDLRDPTRPLAHGAMILVSGALLLTPGFFTDAVGFALLVPAVRDRVMREAARRVRVQRFAVGPAPRAPRAPHHHPGVVDGEWVDVTDGGGGSRADGGVRPAGRSGWTRPD